MGHSQGLRRLRPTIRDRGFQGPHAPGPRRAVHRPHERVVLPQQSPQVGGDLLDRWTTRLRPSLGATPVDQSPDRPDATRHLNGCFERQRLCQQEKHDLVKLLKRQMYGRAGFPLLRQRILLA